MPLVYVYIYIYMNVVFYCPGIVLKSTLSIYKHCYTMDNVLVLFTAMAIALAYLLCFSLLAQKLIGPKAWPLVSSLPYLFMNRRSIHDWIAGNLHATTGAATTTYQTCTIAIPYLAWKQGFYSHLPSQKHRARPPY